MITTDARPAAPLTQAPRSILAGLRVWTRKHWVSLAVIGGLLIIVGAAMAWNLQGWPLWHDDDQGTYVAQARSVFMPSHHIAHYTYWYDHTPGGWALMGLYFWVTDAFARYPLAVMAGREFMWGINLVGCAALYVLARRLNMRRASAAAAVILFGLSPLAIFYHRMVFLDNISTVFLLVALALAASPRRSLGATIASAVFMSAAFWSKETVGLMAMTWLWIVWRNSDRRHRGFWIAGATFFLTSIVGYPLFALLRNELFPGLGHVSLVWSIKWQLFLRAPTGSLLDQHSGTWAQAMSWVHQDPWLLLGGLSLMVAAVFIRKLWPFVLALVIDLAVMVKGGYVPSAYVTIMLPFLAMIIAGVLDNWWSPIQRLASGPRHSLGRIHQKVRQVLPYVGRVPVVAAVLVFAIVAVPAWGRFFVAQSHVNGAVPTMTAEAWVEHHVPKNDVVIVNDDMWADLEMHSGVLPVWIWKVDLDPAVMAQILPKGWRSINYIVWAPKSLGGIQAILDQLPTMKAALAHSVVVARCGDGITINKVINK